MKYPNLPVGDYFGRGRSRGDNELDALKLVRQDLGRNEPDLYQLKWWDYRPLHHIEATRYWAWCYVEGAKFFFNRVRDTGQARSIKGFTHVDVLQTREATAAVMARQAMDRIGVRYPWAFHWIANRFADNGWMNFPRPNQLLGEELMLDMADAWAIECKASLQLPTLQLYREPGAELREMSAQALMDAVRRRAQPGMEWMVVSRLLKEGYVDDAHVDNTFGSSCRSRARSMLGSQNCM